MIHKFVIVDSGNNSSLISLVYNLSAMTDDLANDWWRNW